MFKKILIVFTLLVVVSILIIKDLKNNKTFTDQLNFYKFSYNKSLTCKETIQAIDVNTNEGVNELIKDPQEKINTTICGEKNINENNANFFISINRRYDDRKNLLKNAETSIVKAAENNENVQVTTNNETISNQEAIKIVEESTEKTLNKSYIESHIFQYDNNLYLITYESNGDKDGLTYLQTILNSFVLTK